MSAKITLAPEVVTVSPSWQLELAAPRSRTGSGRGRSTRRARSPCRIEISQADAAVLLGSSWSRSAGGRIATVDRRAASSGGRSSASSARSSSSSACSAVVEQRRGSAPAPRASRLVGRGTTSRIDRTGPIVCVAAGLPASIAQRVDDRRHLLGAIGGDERAARRSRGRTWSSDSFIHSRASTASSALGAQLLHVVLERIRRDVARRRPRPRASASTRAAAHTTRGRRNAEHARRARAPTTGSPSKIARARGRTAARAPAAACTIAIQHSSMPIAPITAKSAKPLKLRRGERAVRDRRAERRDRRRAQRADHRTRERVSTLAARAAPRGSARSAGCRS